MSEATVLFYPNQIDCLPKPGQVLPRLASSKVLDLFVSLRAQADQDILVPF